MRSGTFRLAIISARSVSKSDNAPPANPDVVLVRQFVMAPKTPVEVGSNPLAVALGTWLTGFDPVTRTLAMRYVPQPLFRQGAGVVQGGALAAMLDFAMAFAGFASVDAKTALSTVSMNVVLQRPATADSYEAFGRIDKVGRRAMFASAEIRAGTSVVATATSTLLVV
ncbi:uncharacterized protein (TIGR00369 family) [Amorphus suaedae]